MSKKFNFSVKNDDYFEMELISKQTGKKILEIIRERYDRGKKIENIQKKYDELCHQIKILKQENQNFHFRLLTVLESISRQNMFSNEVLMSILKGNKDEFEIQKFTEMVEKKSHDMNQKMRILYTEN